MVRDTDAANYRDTAFLMVINGLVEESGNAFMELTDFTRADIYQKDFSWVVEKLLRMNCTVDDLKNNNTDTDLFLFSKSLEAREVSISISQLKGNVYLYIFTPKSRLEEKLGFVKQIFSDNMIRAAVYSAPDLIMLKANQTYLDMFDLPFNTIEGSLGKPRRGIAAGFLGSPGEVLRDTILEIQKTIFIKEIECNKFPSGKTYWDSTRTPIFENGKLKYIFEIATEVTDKVIERQRGELISESLIKAKEDAERSNHAITQPLANKNHEIRTLMTRINGMTDLTLMTELTEEQRDYLTIVKSSMRLLLKILNDILDHSKIEAGKVILEQVPFDIREMIHEMVDSFHVATKQKNIKIRLNSMDNKIPKNLIGDSRRLKQVLSNLVGNGVKFTNNGEVTIEIDIEEIAESSMQLRFIVSDTGIGIPEDKLVKLFKRFSQVDDPNTRKFGGIGIGLAISKKLVELMDGDIYVDSKEGVGSVFYFTAKFGVQ
ncbi:MAG TPA: ATP-binding protein [Desulfosporosinus sp.]